MHLAPFKEEHAEARRDFPQCGDVCHVTPLAPIVIFVLLPTDSTGNKVIYLSYFDVTGRWFVQSASAFIYLLLFFKGGSLFLTDSRDSFSTGHVKHTEQIWETSIKPCPRLSFFMAAAFSATRSCPFLRMADGGVGGLYVCVTDLLKQQKAGAHRLPVGSDRTSACAFHPMTVCVSVCVRARTTGPPGTDVSVARLETDEQCVIGFFQPVRPPDTQIARRRPEAAAQERYMRRCTGCEVD